MSPWKSLSWMTGILIFFSGISPVTAEAAPNAPRVITEEIQRVINNPRFACQVLWVKIQTAALSDLQLMLDTSSIDHSKPLRSHNPETGIDSLTFRINSPMWVPGSDDFKNDFAELREIPSLQVVGCQIFGSQSKKN